MSNLTRTDTLAGEGRRTLRAGHPCRVRGLRGHFTFVGIVTNDHTGARWAEVFGGPPGRSMTRAVDPERVRWAKGQR